MVKQPSWLPTRRRTTVLKSGPRRRNAQLAARDRVRNTAASSSGGRPSAMRGRSVVTTAAVLRYQTSRSYGPRPAAPSPGPRRFAGDCRVQGTSRRCGADSTDLRPVCGHRGPSHTRPSMHDASPLCLRALWFEREIRAVELPLLDSIFNNPQLSGVPARASRRLPLLMFNIHVDAIHLYDAERSVDRFRDSWHSMAP